MRMRFWGAVMAVGLAAGCASSEVAAPASSAAVVDESASSGANVSPAPDTTPGAAAPLDDDPSERPLNEDTGEPLESPGAGLVWDDASRSAATTAAGAALTAFARPDPPYEQWWAELTPFLSAQAQVDYQYVDPINVPARAVTGPGVLLDEASVSIARVQVPTDVGDYVLILSRTEADAASWLVESITPPEGVN